MFVLLDEASTKSNERSSGGYLIYGGQVEDLPVLPSAMETQGIQSDASQDSKTLMSFTQSSWRRKTILLAFAHSTGLLHMGWTIPVRESHLGAQ